MLPRRFSELSISLLTSLFLIEYYIDNTKDTVRGPVRSVKIVLI